MGFETCGPDEVLVVSGCCHEHSRFISNGRVFVWPSIQQVQRLPANLMTLSVENLKAHSKNGIQVSVLGVAEVKICKNVQDILRVAAENCLGKTEEQIGNILREIVQGHQRAVIGAMNIEDIYCDRKKFSLAVFEQASNDVINMGFQLVSFKVENVLDEEGYLMARKAERARNEATQH
ncbi:hypothetical protein RRG08_018962 [Elysia crispata]|uniref:Band 7 domain-containing protein n=1 Tax=Elysia crispata TaxID=231223 RepID=A0AAE1DT43_9GAST|nr:hypothetical protein RRG08_018962 [Elysia crispata]